MSVVSAGRPTLPRPALAVRIKRCRDKLGVRRAQGRRCVQGLAWLVRMYAEGLCSDYRFSYEHNSPSVAQLQGELAAASVIGAVSKGLAAPFQEIGEARGRQPNGEARPAEPSGSGARAWPAGQRAAAGGANGAAAPAAPGAAGPAGWREAEGRSRSPLLPTACALALLPGNGGEAHAPSVRACNPRGNRGVSGLGPC